MKNPPHPEAWFSVNASSPWGLTITGAAQALGVTRNSLSELVHGKRGISSEMAVNLSRVFGGTEQGWLVSAVQFLYLETPEMPWGKECFPRVRVATKLPSVLSLDEVELFFRQWAD